MEIEVILKLVPSMVWQWTDSKVKTAIITHVYVFRKKSIFLFIENMMSSPIKPTSLLESNIIISGGICVYDGQQCTTTDIGTDPNIFVEDRV